MTIEDLYIKTPNVDGVIIRINEVASGLPLVYYPETKTFDDSHYLTIRLYENQDRLGEILDLSDLEPEPKNPKKKIRLNSLQSSDQLIIDERFPEDLNYNTGLVIGLTNKTIDYFGLRVAKIYYQTLDSETFAVLNDPISVVYERYKYDWDANNYVPTSRVKETRFYQEDGTLTERIKILPKIFYNVNDRNDIVKHRRQAIVDYLIARATELDMETETKNYFSLYKAETDNYISYGDQDIVGIVQNSTESFLDNDTNTELGTMRQAIIICLNKALELTPNAEVDSYLSEIGVA